MKINEVAVYVGPARPRLGLTEGAYTHGQYLTEQQLLENFLDSIKQYIGSKADQTIQNVQNTITNYKEAGLLIKEILENDELFEVVEVQINKLLRMGIQELRANQEQNKFLKLAWTKLTPMFNRVRQASGWLGVIGKLIFIGILKFLNQGLEKIVSDAVVDDMYDKVAYFVGNIIKRTEEITMPWFVKTLQAFKTLDEYFFETLSYIRQKLRSVQIKTTGEPVEESNDGTQEEVFHFGNKSWDVKRGYQLVKQHNIEPEMLPVEGGLASFLGFMRVNKDWAKTTDLSKPVLLIDTGKGVLVIDGYHRIKKAKDEGVAELPGYILPQEMSDEIEIVSEDVLSNISESMSSINQEVDGGSLEGYVVTTDMPQLQNYLSSQGVDSNIIKKLTDKFNTIAIIKNMYVDDDYRGQGLGNELINVAIDSAIDRNAEAIILVSDTGESNEFDLTQWYSGFGFKVIGNAGGDPLMIMNLSGNINEGPLGKALGTAAVAGAVGLAGHGAMKTIDNLSSIDTNQPAKVAQAPAQAKQNLSTITANPQKNAAKPESNPQKSAGEYQPITGKKNEMILAKVAQQHGIQGVELAAFMAQMAHESENFIDMVEDGNGWKKYGKGRAAKNLGNRDMNDAERFKGRGFIQLTGRWNYNHYGKKIGMDLTSSWSAAHQAADPEVAALIAVEFWKSRVQPNVTDFADVAQVTKPINPGLNGLEDRQKKFSWIAGHMGLKG